MSRNLRIDSLFVEQFGGLSNRILTIDCPGLVIVHGKNEAGKSTVATLLSWLLVGPDGTAEDSHRFGRPEDQLSGRVEGEFDGRPMRIEGRFKLLKSGAPRGSNISVSLEERTIGVDELRLMLGGIDSRVFQSIYRMWGGDLHVSRGVLDQVADVALAGFGGKKNINDVVSFLERQRTKLIESTAKDSISWQALEKVNQEVDREIERLGSNANEYLRACSDLDEMNLSLARFRQDVTELGIRLNALRVLEAVSSDRQREREIRLDLEALAEVPESWVPLVRRSDDLKQLASERSSEESLRITTRESVDELAASLGVGEEKKTLLQVDPSRAVAVTRLHENLKAAQRSLSEAERQASKSSHEERATHQALLEATDGIAAIGVVVDDVAIPTEEESQTLHQKLRNWSKELEQLESAKDQVAEQRVKVRVAEAELQNKQGFWESFGLAVTPQQWRVSPASPADVAVVSNPRSQLIVGLFAAGLTIVVILGLPRIAAVVISALVFGGYFVFQGRNRTIRVPSQRSGQVGGPEQELQEAATDVIAAVGIRDDHLRELARLEALQENLNDRVEQAKRDLEKDMRQFGVDSNWSLSQWQALVARMNEVRETVSAHGDALTRLEIDRDSSASAAEVVDRLTDEASSLLENCGLKGLDFDFVAGNVDEFLNLANRLSELRRLDERIKHLEGEFIEICRPVTSPTDEKERNTLLSELEAFVELHDKRKDLDHELNQINERVNGRFRENKIAKQLSNEFVSLESISEEIAGLEVTLGVGQDSIEQLNQEIGRSKTRINELSEENFLASLRLKKGENQDLSDSHLVRGVAHAIAKSLLAKAASERRRNRQPDLVKRASELLKIVSDDWEEIILGPNESGSVSVSVAKHGGQELSSTRLSTGAQALTHLAIRLATAEMDGERRQVKFPLLCDDPLVHFDDERARLVMPLLSEIASRGRQIILLTCHERTVEVGRAVGAKIVHMSDTSR